MRCTGRIRCKQSKICKAALHHQEHITGQPPNPETSRSQIQSTLDTYTHQQRAKLPDLPSGDYCMHSTVSAVTCAAEKHNQEHVYGSWCSRRTFMSISICTYFAGTHTHRDALSQPCMLGCRANTQRASPAVTPIPQVAKHPHAPQNKHCCSCGSSDKRQQPC
jgi:hypothetical protein